MGDNAQAGFYWSSLGDPRDNESAALSWRERRRGSADFVIFFFFFFRALTFRLFQIPSDLFTSNDSRTARDH